MEPTTTQPQTGPTPEQQRALLSSANSLAPGQQTRLNQLNTQLGEPVDISQSPVPFTVPETQASRAPSFVAGLTPIMEGIQSSIAAQQQTVDSDRQLIEQILGQSQQLPGQFQQQIQEASAPFQQQITGLNEELKRVRSQFEEQAIREEQAGGGTAPAALSRVGQIRANQARMEAPIIASIQVAQGQLQNAQNIVRDMFDLQRDALNTNLNTLMQFQAQNEDRLSRSQQQQLDLAIQAEQARVQEQQAVLDDQEQAAIYANSLIARGADPQEVARDIQRGITTQEALAKYGRFEAQRTEEEQLQFSEQELRNQLLRGQIAETDAAKRKIEADIERIQSDPATGQLLSTSEMIELTKLPDTKRIDSLTQFNNLLQRYQSLVDTYGTTVRGKARGQMESVLGALQIAYKDAAELGALVGADFDLLDRVIPNATSDNFVEDTIKSLRGRGKQQILSSLDETINRTQQNVADSVIQLGNIDPRYLQTDYVNNLIGRIQEDTSVNQDPLNLLGGDGQDPNNPLGIDL